MKTKKLFCAFAVVATAFAMASCQSEPVEEMTVDLNINVTASTTPEFEATIEDNCGNKVSTRTAVSSSPNSKVITHLVGKLVMKSVSLMVIHQQSMLLTMLVPMLPLQESLATSAVTPLPSRRSIHPL